ncbi:YraN family protein [Candidatus Saccharibacteria bacterium CPR2]|nr:YraN family protein [Candidatus Saccharibacteria bacterium CPR2]
MNTTGIGKNAESAAAEYVSGLGFKVITQNWKRPMCEIDLIATKDGVVYFIEVKYRKSDDHGGGLDYITSKKLDQMKFAAKCWISENRYKGNYELSAIEASGQNQKITAFIQELT